MAVVGLIGPTDIEEAAKSVRRFGFLRRSPRFFEYAARIIGRAIAESGHDLWVNAEVRGMPVLVGRAYKEAGGGRLVVLLAMNEGPWPPLKDFALQDVADEIRQEKSWFWANYRVVSTPNIVVCAGRSTGVDSEIGYLKWNLVHKIARPRLVLVRELLHRGRLDRHQELPLREIIVSVSLGDFADALHL